MQRWVFTNIRKLKMKFEIQNKRLVVSAENNEDNKKLFSLLTEEEPKTPKVYKKKSYKRQVASEQTRCNFCGKMYKGQVGKRVHEFHCNWNPKNMSGLQKARNIITV